QSTAGLGATRKIVLPLLEAKTHLTVGTNLFLSFAAERIDPGNDQFPLTCTPKLVGGITEKCTDLTVLLFEQVIDSVIPVSSPEVAELSKLVENSFRFINISFINELAILCDRCGLDIWEVIAAASTKPYGFLPHFPGPGIGGDCIPVAPFSLQHAMRDHGLNSSGIDAFADIDDGMPDFV